MFIKKTKEAVMKGYWFATRGTSDPHYHFFKQDDDARSLCRRSHLREVHADVEKQKQDSECCDDCGRILQSAPKS